jgi:cyd operon protein YbgT
MWYFTWILGVLLACAFGIINVLWLEAQEGLDQDTAVLDPLTKLPTRVEFLESLEEKIDQIIFTLLLVSVDALKLIAEQGDNEKADQTVLLVADIIKRETRQPLDVVARYDAQTFAIILPATETSTAEAIAQRICENAEDQIQQTKGSIISIGIAEYPAHLTCAIDESIQNKITAILQITDQALKNAQQGNKRIYSAAIT